jgi:hypothetical protein
MFVRQQSIMRRTFAGLVCAAALSLFGASAQAGLTTLNLGGGWQASWDDALNPFLSINSLGVVGGTLFIQKSAEFTNLNPINVTFTALTPSAVTSIAIDDEIITNSTGVTWVDFHMHLQPSAGDAVWDVASSAGFSVNPFTASSFTNGNHSFNAFNGSVTSGSVWFPGLISGQLHIDVTPPAPGALASFVLSEVPSIPAPGALALLGIAGVISGGRRRR